MRNTAITIGALSVVVLILFILSIGSVPIGARGIQTRYGAVTGYIRQEGMFFKVPFIEGNKNIDVRTYATKVNLLAGSQENQSLKIQATASWHIDPNKVGEYYRQFGQNESQESINSIVSDRLNEKLKSAAATIPADEALRRADEIRELAKPGVAEDLKQYYLVLDNLVVNDIDYLDEYNKAIEAKAKAEQDALAAKNKLEQSKYEAQQAIEIAKGKAEAQKIEGEALRSNPEVLQLRAVERWNGSMPTYWGGDALPFLNIK